MPPGPGSRSNRIESGGPFVLHTRNMAQQPEGDGSEDVNDFLVRIRELGNKRDKEDEERTKKLEEEILQGRKERQARRAGKHPAVALSSRPVG